jgi:hypothetical protein
MASGIADYSTRSAKLLTAAQRLSEGAAATDRVAQKATTNLLRVAERSATESLNLGFAADASLAAPIGVTEGLAAALFDLQAGNVLIAEGIRQAESAPMIKGDTTLLSEPQLQIQLSRNELLRSPGTSLGFDAKLNQSSATIEAAVGGFRSFSDKLLGEIVKDAQSTVLLARDGLGKVDTSALGELLKRIGDPFPFAADVGKLIQKGSQLLKNGIEAIVALFGTEKLIQVRDAVSDVWLDIANLGDILFERLLGVASVKRHISEILLAKDLIIKRVDNATNALAPLAASFNSDNKLLRAIIRAIGLAGALFGWLHAAGPWYTVGLGVAYGTAIGAVLIVGRQYTGALPIRNQGVEQLAEAIAKT